MAEVINLRTVRKQAKRQKRDQTAQTNRLAFGQPKHLRKLEAAQQAKASRDLDRRRIEKRGPPMKSPVVKRSIVIAGHKTSVSLEDAFWKGLKEIATGREVTLSDLVASIDTDRRHGNLSSAIRLFVLDHYRVHSVDDHSSMHTDTRDIPGARVIHSVLRAD